MTYSSIEQQRAYQREWIAKRRQAWILENGPCKQCGSWEDLEVDHIDKDSKVLDPSKLWSMSPNNPKRIAELAKCQVLCGHCHMLKTKAELDNPNFFTHVEHGLGKTGKKNCRCKLCGPLKLRYKRELSRKK